MQREQQITEDKQNCLSIEGRSPANVCTQLTLDPLTLILDLDQDALKKYLRTETEVSMSRLSKVIDRTG